MSEYDEKIFTILKGELEFARSKFPDTEDMFHALVEEVGELGQAMIQQKHEKHKGKTDKDVLLEAIQTAVMAIRIATEGVKNFPYNPVNALEEFKVGDIVRFAEGSTAIAIIREVKRSSIGISAYADHCLGGGISVQFNNCRLATKEEIAFCCDSDYASELFSLHVKNSNIFDKRYVIKNPQGAEYLNSQSYTEQGAWDRLIKESEDTPYKNRTKEIWIEKGYSCFEESL